MNYGWVYDFISEEFGSIGNLELVNIYFILKCGHFKLTKFGLQEFLYIFHATQQLQKIKQNK